MNTKQLQADGAAFTLGARQDISKVRLLTDELLAVQERIMKGEALLKQLKELERDITYVRLPAAMTENGVKKLELDDGRAVELAPIIEGSIPQDRMAEAAQWLRKNGHSQLLRRELTLSFKAGQDKMADTAREALESKGYEVVDRIQVHHMSLKGWAREMIERGANLPLDLLGIFVGQRAKIKLPKEQ